MRLPSISGSCVRARQWLSLSVVALAACGGGGGDGGTTGTPTPTPTIGVTVAPATVTLTQAQSGTVTVTLARGGNYSGAVSLAVTGAPNGVTATVEPASLSGGTLTSTLTVNAGASATAGNATLTVTGSGTGVTSSSATVGLTVNAAAPATNTLTVTASGTGAGTITSSPAGINCPGTCSASFTAGATVTLTAAPTGGSTFGGWVGACSGTTLTCAVTVSAAQSVTATFTAPAAGFTLAVAPTSVTVPAGGTASAQVNVTRANYTGLVAVATTGAPTGLTVIPNPVAVTGNAGTLDIAAAATVAPGNYTITVTGTGVGVTQQTATLTITVTAPASFALAVAPTSLSVQQGGSGAVQVNVTRGGGFTGPVSLAFTGAPNGLTLTPNPASVTGASSTVTVAAGSTTAPGTYTITVTGTGAGAAQQTTTFSVQVTQAPTGGGGNVTYSFANCDPAQVPIWFAAQNGNGAWTRVNAGANNSFSFTVGANGGVAYVTQRGTTSTLTVLYASGAELAGTTNQCASPVAPPQGTKTLTGSVAGVTTTDVATVSIGGSLATVIPITGLTTYTLTGVASGPRDLIANRSVIAGASVTLNKLIIRRNTNYPNNSVIPTLDFNGSEAFDPVQRTLTLNNLGTDQAFASVSFVTANGAGLSFFTGTSTSATMPFFAVPNAQLLPTDYHELLVGASPAGSSPTSFRFVYTFFQAATDRSLTLGPSLSGSTITSLATAPHLRLRAQLPSQSAYNGLAVASYTQTGHTANVSATAAYFGGAPATWTLDIPDLASAGFDPTWGLRTGAPLNWTVGAFGGDFLLFAGGTPTNGAQIVGANASGSSMAFVQYLRSRGIMPIPKP